MNGSPQERGLLFARINGAIERWSESTGTSERKVLDEVVRPWARDRKLDPHVFGRWANTDLRALLDYLGSRV